MVMLKLDIDRKKLDRKKLIHNIKKLMRTYEIERSSVSLFSTKKGYHVYIRMITDRAISSFEIVIMQLFLGSDKDRELFNLERIRRNETDWNVLFILKRRGSEIISRETLIEMFDVVV